MLNLRWSCALLAATAFSCSCPFTNAVDKTSGDTSQQESFVATHKQAKIIEVTHSGTKVQLNTFAVAKNGDLLACVTAPPKATRQPAETRQPAKEDAKSESVDGYLQVYSPEGKLLRETAMTFIPTAVNELPDGCVLVAGVGQIAKVASTGKVLVTMPSPHVGDIETLTKRIAETAKTQLQDATKRYRDMVEQIETRIAKIEETAKEERSARDLALLKSLPAQKKIYQEQADRMEQSYAQIYSPENLLRRKLGITSVAVTPQDIFLCCNSMEGYGYDVWRVDHELSSPKQIVTGLGGCCGQCDVQAAGENIVIGENTKFKVSLMDRDGKSLTSFGDRDRTSENGFGSCCNPMNVRCCSNGDILTAESSVGNIKRFSKDGKYLGLVGKAKIGGGCKHVAVGVDEKRNRYYTMNIDKDHICVMVPLSEAPEMTPDELLAKAALDTHGTRFFGTWETETAAAAAENTREISYVVTLPDGTQETRTRKVTTPTRTYEASKYVFHSDGSLDVEGGLLATYSNAWEAVSHDKSSITLSHFRDGIQYYNLVVDFAEPDVATISLKRGTHALSSQKFRRTACGDDCQKETNSTGTVSETNTTSAA
ncbi:MAG: hypothetical protein WBH50_25465, partial [Fuerstiella sp.]